ncbi:predicted protein [Ixodes scapularis]|uniref:Predicted protein n=1 Tax=Ixodes scapularis TaxID=6945 RepID=B7QFR2_IXOSC|nr:predicted protein [Ixodes scapularis]|eukprot:XP_002414376.1 predicted protein [Ixodes scapularis]
MNHGAGQVIDGILKRCRGNPDRLGSKDVLQQLKTRMETGLRDVGVAQCQDCIRLCRISWLKSEMWANGSPSLDPARCGAMARISLETPSWYRDL